MSLEIVELDASWPLVLPYFDGKVPAGSLSWRKTTSKANSIF